MVLFPGISFVLNILAFDRIFTLDNFIGKYVQTGKWVDLELSDEVLVIKKTGISE